MNGFWTPDRERLLADLVAGNLSAKTIAASLGCSRNAVIGKVLRGKGRFGRLSGWSAPGERKRPEARRRAAACPAPAMPAARPEPRPAMPPLPPSASLVLAPITFDRAVDEGRCLYFACDPYAPSGPDMPVCGHERAWDAPPLNRYCARHRAAMTQGGAST